MSEKELKVGTEPQVQLASINGSVRIAGVKGDALIARSNDENMEITLEWDRVTITAAADLELSVPQKAQVTLEQVEGDASLEHLLGALTIKAVFGEITLLNVAQARIEGASRDRFADFATRQADRIARKVELEVGDSMKEAGRKVRSKVGRKSRKWNINWSSGAQPNPDPVSDEERLTILRMLQEKKITSEEADKLLSALE
ncbi:MAG: hypothetical protein JXA13_08835 [Anaerolineales bacterium]|nr:hypothetical protein [Anaerolineales bacterium]